MNIALDYDRTYTLDPHLWDTFIEISRLRGHKIYTVTARDFNSPEGNHDIIEDLLNKTDGMYFTNGVGKEKFMAARMIKIDVWIDDMPERITTGIMDNVKRI